jgi:hypothetical protein
MRLIVIFHPSHRPELSKNRFGKLAGPEPLGAKMKTAMSIRLLFKRMAT